MFGKRRARPESDETAIRAFEVRTNRREILIGIFIVTAIVWVISFIPFYFATDMFAYQLERLGFLPVLLGWLVMSVVLAASYAGGYFILTAVTTGMRMVTERGVVRLALGDAFSAACGGVIVGALPAITVDDLFFYFLWILVVGWLFSFSQLNPRYVARWQEIAVQRGFTS